MSEPELQFVKKFMEEHLKKGFIKASSAPCLLPIMLTVKPGGGVWFCMDYRRLNKLIVKDTYLISLIKETLAQLKNAKVFTKIDIRQAFHKLQMAADSENYTTFSCRFGAFKWKVLSFALTGGQHPGSILLMTCYGNILIDFARLTWTIYWSTVVIWRSTRSTCSWYWLNFVNLAYKQT